MARGVARSQGSAGENIQHFSHLRMRLQGEGNLKTKLISLDPAYFVQNADQLMASVTDIEPTILTNFVTQRAAIEFFTTEENEYLRINRVIVFLRDYGSEYPM